MAREKQQRVGEGKSERRRSVHEAVERATTSTPGGSSESAEWLVVDGDDDDAESSAK